MDRTERFYIIEQRLRTHAAVPVRDFLKDMGVSIATFKRDLEYLRDRLYAPIVWDRARRGYRFADPDPRAPRHELPGLWFNSSEAHALLTMHHLLENLQPGLLASHIEPLKLRIKALLESQHDSTEEAMARIRLLPMAARRVQHDHFEIIAKAVLQRQRLIINHYSRERDAETEREISPQRLAHYRDNWYLDAWDHGKDALRIFSVDSIRKVTLLDKKARNIPDKALDAELGSGYGIFAGRKTQTAVLRFTPERARWVANEQWHPKQKARYESGYYLLEIPYSDDRELIMDILKYGPDVEVTTPASLRRRVWEQLQSAARRYDD
ncbi:MAG: WYL domain-containing protein [Gammaproteobacteria bacterium]|nr:WYL domain-containing protein [Gammaproteobacteria bacterium]